MTTRRSSRIRGDIGLGDLAEVLVELKLEETEHLRLASNLLGFTGLATRKAGKPQVAAKSEIRKAGKRRKKEKKTTPRHALPSTPEQLIKPDGRLLNSTLTLLSELESSQAPDWLKPVDPGSGKKNNVIRQRLFPRNQSAGILKASLAVRRPGRRLDIPKIIELAVSAKPLTELPHLQIGGLENGVDLFCDYSESMQPFYADLNNLKNSLHQIYGANRCRCFEYDTDPTEAESWNALEQASSWSPIAGRPVLLATDFGHARQDPHRRLQLRDWRQFVRNIQLKKTPLLVCSPLPPSALPTWLGREVKIIHWDPRTRAGAVSRIIGIGHEIDL